MRLLHVLVLATMLPISASAQKYTPAASQPPTTPPDTVLLSCTASGSTLSAHELTQAILDARDELPDVKNRYAALAIILKVCTTVRKQIGEAAYAPCMNAAGACK